MHNWPLMHDNISRSDLNHLISYLSTEDPRLTHGAQVRSFEEAWSDWVGVNHTVMVNSGSSANDLTMMAMRELHGPGEILMSPLGWVSDVSSVIHAGFKPAFVDIDPVTLSVSSAEVARRIGPQTKALLLVHILGLNGLTENLGSTLATDEIPLIEDVCESHGATFQGKRCGSIGLASNFSFYYAHHLSTIEGGAICTDSEEFADVCRMLRSHGLVRESRSELRRATRTQEYPDLNPEFIFDYLARNNRPTELNGVLGLAQLPRLNENIEVRKRNFAHFMSAIDGELYQDWFDVETSSNYAFIVVLKDADFSKRDRVEQVLHENGIEFRRGLSGGGSQLRQPYMKRILPDVDPRDFPHTEHVHHFGWYIGNHPGITLQQVEVLADLLNGV